MLRRLIGEDINLITALDRDAGHVNVDVTQMEQVLMNLVVNARDAMPKGGTLRVETRNIWLDGTFSSAKDVEAPVGAYLLLAVTDSGTGMDEETQSKIFEPFYTTKDMAKGTGLGLSTVYGIVMQSGGFVSVHSELDVGTTFEIYLPRAPSRTGPERPRRLSPHIMKGVETILLVEDDAAVRKAAARILERAGYEVLVAAEGAEALLLCQTRTAPIHLMLTDVVMPRIGGKDLADRVAAHQPLMRVLFMSGYTDDAILHHGILDGEAAFLHKPFTPDTLLRKVRDVLSSE
jgi:CheY-like chemotaxis protein